MTNHPALSILVLTAKRVLRGERVNGYVYFVQAKGGGPTKIGWTRHPPTYRLEQLQSGCPIPLVVRAALPGTMREEREFHEIFAADRLHGEWFSESEDLRELVEFLARHDLWMNLKALLHEMAVLENEQRDTEIRKRQARWSSPIHT